MINIEKIKEYIKCPQFGDLEYGKWGTLNLEQRVAYKELIEENEELQKCHKDMLDINLENEQELNKLHSIIKEVENYLDENIKPSVRENKMYDFVGDLFEIYNILDKER